jgi:hypothetical protein
VSNPDFANPGTANYAWHEGTHDGANGHLFNIVTTAIDEATNNQTVLSTRTFIFDNVPPTSAPTAPIANSAYSSLATISGTLNDDVSGVSAVVVSILDVDAAGGAKFFNGASFSSSGEQWLSVLPANVFASSWVFTNGALAFTTQHHYIVKSSATDGIGNVQTAAGQSQFLYDTDPPLSAVTNPANLITYTDSKILIGTAADPGFTSGISGTGAGVFPTAAWAQGQIEISVYRDSVSAATDR